MAKSAKEAKADKITDKTEVSVSELALVIGKSANRIYQMSTDGIIQTSRRGHFLLCDSVQRYINFLSKDAVSEADLKLENARRTAEAALKASKAQIAKMEVEELQGKRHRSEDVAAMTEDLIYTIRGALLALPGRLAVDTSTAKSPAEAAEIIRKEVYAVMQDLSEYRYDPKKYEERVRARRDWEIYGEGDTGDE